MKEQSCDR